MTMPKTTEKPREFWITESRCTGKQKAHKTQLECWGEIQHNDNEYHVIEYAAYEKLKAENERLMRERDSYAGYAKLNDELMEERDTLKAKLAEVEAERDECIKVHDENINLMREFQKLMNQCANELEREREAAKVMREALDKVKQFCIWLSVDSIKYQGTDAANAARWEMAAIVDALAKADEIRGGK